MRTRTRQTRALIVKDLRLHGRAFALTLAAGLLLCLTLNRVEPQAVGARVSLVCNINLLLTLLWSDWLITRERSKRTFAWLRGLPVDDGVLASAKFLVAGGCCVTFWLTSSMLSAREIWQPLSTGLVVQCALVAFGGLSLATKWRFPWRLGQVLPLLILLVPLLLATTLAGDGTAGREMLFGLWNAPYGRPVAAAALLAVYATLVAVTVRWVTRADTFQLVD
jgi:hypothetical protein